MKSMQLRRKLLVLIPKRWRVPLFKLKAKLFYPQLFKNWGKKFTIKELPILILSLPRSGSSWLGEVLAQPQNIRYLREPITSVYMPSVKQGVSFFMPSECLAPNLYKQAITKAFSAKLDYVYGAIHNKARWFKPGSSKKLLIKEVNPLYLKDYLEKHNPLVIYLERDPYSIAKSFAALAWQTDDLFSKRFDTQTINKMLLIKANLLTECFYYQMGFLQGVVKAINEPHLSNSNVLSVNYENLVTDPRTELLKVANFLNLNLNDLDIINEYASNSLSSNKSIKEGEFSTSRGQLQLINKQQQQITEPNYQITKEAYNFAYNEFKKYL